MARLRYNNALGTLGGAGLTASGTTITFASAPSFATIVSPDYIPIILDPPSGITPSSTFEVVYLTAYTAAATTGTITRAQEGTSGSAHAAGNTWVCAPLAYDLLPIVENYAKFTAASSTWVIPTGVTTIRVRAVGGGGSGGGAPGGGNNTPGAGVGGGAAGTVIDVMVTLSGDTSLTVTCGAGGTGGTGGATGNFAGTQGTSGSDTTVVGAQSATTYVTATGGVRGYILLNSYAGGQYGAGNPPQPSTQQQAGDGGSGSQFSNGSTSGQPFLYVVGGAGGGAGNQVPPDGGGTGGSAATSLPVTVQTGGTLGGRGFTTSGGNGQTATIPGCGGGGGGGGGDNGGAGGNGGDGARGQVEIWW